MPPLVQRNLRCEVAQGIRTTCVDTLEAKVHQINKWCGVCFLKDPRDQLEGRLGYKTCESLCILTRRRMTDPFCRRSEVRAGSTVDRLELNLATPTESDRQISHWLSFVVLRRPDRNLQPEQFPFELLFKSSLFRLTALLQSDIHADCGMFSCAN